MTCSHCNLYLGFLAPGQACPRCGTEPLWTCPGCAHNPADASDTALRFHKHRQPEIESRSIEISHEILRDTVAVLEEYSQMRCEAEPFGAAEVLETLKALKALLV
jgi:hypothetical protein